MKSKKFSLILIIILIFLSFYKISNESRFEKWSKILLCPVCQGEVIYDSPSEYASDMKDILQEQIQTGYTDEQIYNFWVTRYGERIVTDNIARNFEIILIPIAIISIFIIIFLRKINAKK